MRGLKSSGIPGPWSVTFNRTRRPSDFAFTSTVPFAGENRVGEQVGQHLQEPVLVDLDRDVLGRLGQLQAHAQPMRVGVGRLHGLVHDLREPTLLDVERHAARGDLVDVEDVVDEPDEPIAVAASDLEQAMWVWAGREADCVPSTRPIEPRIDVSGVRNSWLTIEMKSFFTRYISRSSLMS
jgi:hypothetical protein